MPSHFKFRPDSFFVLIFLGFSAKTWAYFRGPGVESNGLVLEAVVLLILVMAAFARSLRLLRRK